MVHKTDISPQIAKLARRRSQSLGMSMSNELARAVAIEEIVNADPQAALLLDEDAAYSSHDQLVAAFCVNDIVVNGVRLDVRAVDQEGRISLSRALVGTSYMTAGTLAVALDGALGGKVIGFVEASQWLTIDGSAADESVLFVKAPTEDNFDVAKRIPAITGGHRRVKAEQPEPFEMAAFLANRAEIPLPKQKAFVEYTLSAQNSWEPLSKLVQSCCRSQVKRVLSDAAVWSSRVERITRLVAPKSKHLSSRQIAHTVAKIGETMGGQPESPSFRRALLSALSREELAHSLGGALLKKACAVAESVISGRAVNDAVKDAAANQIAVKIAAQIRQQRLQVSRFADATAQELAAAFQQLSLQAAYATHSSDAASGVESINEALKLMDAAELAKAMQELDSAILQI